MPLTNISKPTTTVTFRIFSPEVIPDDITEKLKIQPNTKYVKGDYPLNYPQYSPYENGLWSLTSKALSEEPLESHLDSILLLLEGERTYILNISKYATVDFYCVLYDQYSFQLSAQILTRIANIGAILGVTVEPPVAEDEINGSLNA